MKKSCLVTGATGFIGLNFVNEVLKNEHFDTMYCLTREGSQGLDHLRNMVEESKSSVEVRILTGDIRDEEALKKVFPDKLDAIFHLAGNMERYITENNKKIQNDVNILGTKNLVSLSLEHDAGRFIHISCSKVYLGGIWDYGIGEADEISEESEKLAESKGTPNRYQSKYYAELEVHEGVKKGLDAVILQPCHVMGPFDYFKNIGNKFVRDIRVDNSKFLTQGEIVVTDTRVLARAMIAAFEKGKKGEEYLIGGPHVCYEDVMKFACEHWEKGNLASLGFQVMMFAGVAVEYLMAMRNCFCAFLGHKNALLSREIVIELFHKLKVDSSKALKELEYEEVELEDTLKVVCEFFDELDESKRKKKEE